MSALYEKRRVVDELERECIQSVQTLRDSLDEEEEEDSQWRATFRDRWTRKSSPEDNAEYRSRLADIRYKVQQVSVTLIDPTLPLGVNFSHDAMKRAPSPCSSSMLSTARVIEWNLSI